MVDTREKFRELLNDIARRDGIKRFSKLVELTGISANTFTNIKKNEVKEVSLDTFWKLNNAFKNRYNVKWFQGDSYYMLMEDYLAAKNNLELDVRPSGERYQTILSRAQDIQRSVLGHVIQELMVNDGNAADEPRNSLPVWADALIGILSKQIAENEVLHSELQKSLKQISELIEKLSK